MMQFIDLQAQQKRIRSQIESAITNVLTHGAYILGPEVAQLEHDLSQFCGARHSVTCSDGTDALSLALRAKQVKPGDAVFVPTFTFAATAEVVALAGATPVFIDILEDTFNLDPLSLERGIETAKTKGLKPIGVIPVDLFGQPADYDAIQAIAKQHHLWIIADAAQSFGAFYHKKRVGQLAEITTTSFFPAKPLGCYGDGGAVFTTNDEVAHVLKSLRVHGQGEDKYHNERVGLNSRLDTIQAAILIEKLKIFEDELEKRQAAAEIYESKLKAHLKVPLLKSGCTSSWAQYTVTLPQSVDRAHMMQKMKSAGIPTAIYYPKPLHHQKAYANYPTAGDAALPIAEKISPHVLSLPMHPYLTHEAIETVAATLIQALRGS